MAPPEDNPEMIFIFDVNGFIAGMHSVVAKKFVSPMFDFGGSKWYRDAGNAFVTTAYFIDPMRICNGGRTQEEFDVEGTGNRLLFQNGPTANDVLVAPLTLDSVDADVSKVVPAKAIYFIGNHVPSLSLSRWRTLTL